MNESPGPGTGPSSAAEVSPTSAVCERFEKAWGSGSEPRLEDYLVEQPPEQQRFLFAELLELDLVCRRRAGVPVDLSGYLQRFPQFSDLLREKIEQQDTAASDPLAGRDSAPAADAPPPVPTSACLGRYRIRGPIGKGGFGVVYRGRDEELRRDVAIKVPHRHRIAAPEDVEAYLNEARTLASLDHPHIVPVYDFGRTDDGLCYVVSKFIDGSNLKRRLCEARPSWTETAELIATIAEALHHAHRQGLVHRDVKPANILLDAAGKPYLTDFGLVLREEDFGKGTGYAGTPVYMSPEQARCEGHRVDGRSDIFSLGVVLYEMLTGRRPFRAETLTETLALIADADARPPRQIDDTIPAELERICLKALARRVGDRYSTARDFAEELHAWLGRSASPLAPPQLAAPQPTASGWLHKVLAGVVLAGLSGLFLVAVLGGNRSGDRAPTTPAAHERQSPEEAVRQEPTVKKLIWTGRPEVCQADVLRETNQLKVYTDSLSLLQLGETEADSWTFSATLRQLAWKGQIGVFFGYRKDQLTSTARYDVLSLLVLGNEASLQLQPQSYRLDAQFINPEGGTHTEFRFKKPDPTLTIRVVVRDNKLAEVRVDGKVAASLTKYPLPSTADGAFGVFNNNSEGVYSTLKFNDAPIPLRAEGKPQ